MSDTTRTRQADLLDGIEDTMEAYESVGGVAEIVVTPERRAALTAGAAALRSQAQGWQRIETAPKDVTIILGGAGCVEQGGWLNDAWWGDVDAAEGTEPLNPQPTYWQPLPAPPVDLPVLGEQNEVTPLPGTCVTCEFHNLGASHVCCDHPKILEGSRDTPIWTSMHLRANEFGCVYHSRKTPR